MVVSGAGYPHPAAPLTVREADGHGLTQQRLSRLPAECLHRLPEVTLKGVSGNMCKDLHCVVLGKYAKPRIEHAFMGAIEMAVAVVVEKNHGTK